MGAGGIRLEKDEPKKKRYHMLTSVLDIFIYFYGKWLEVILII